MADSLSARVRQAMKESGVNQVGLAAELHIQPDKISKSLKGKRKFSSSELAGIARFTKTSVEWLLTGTEIATPKFAGRITAAPSETTDWLQLGEEYAAADESLRRLGYGHDLVEYPEYVETKSFVRHGQRSAEWALGRLNKAGWAPWEDGLIEHLEDVFSVDVAIVDLPSGCHGFTWQTDSFRLICVARTSNWARQRFTLAHELGHILSGDAMGQVVDERNGSDWHDHFIEKSANAFAGAFLMPEEDVVDLWNELSGDTEARFEKLAWRLRVSPAALAARLQKLNLLTDAQKVGVAQLTMLDVASYLEHEDDFDRQSTTALSHRAPRRLTQGFRTAYREGKTSVRTLARLHEMSPEDYLAVSDQTPGDREVSVSLSDEA